MNGFERALATALVILAGSAIGADLNTAGAAPSPGEQTLGEIKMEGIARGISGELLYTEHYLNAPEAPRWKVEYRWPDGSQLATKEVDFSSSAAAPQFTLHYKDRAHSTGAFRQEEQLVLFDGSEQRRFDIPRLLVVDAGFHRLVQQRWPEDAVEFDFALSHGTRVVALEIERAKSSDSPLEQHGEFHFRIQAQNMFLRWIIDPIWLAYSSERLLCGYHGPSNLRLDGTSPQVYIRYSYADSDACSGPAASTTTPSEPVDLKGCAADQC